MTRQRADVYVQGDTGTGTTGSGGTPPGGSGWTPPGSSDPAVAGKEGGPGSGSALAPLLLGGEGGLRNNSNPRVRASSGGVCVGPRTVGVTDHGGYAALQGLCSAPFGVKMGAQDDVTERAGNRRHDAAGQRPVGLPLTAACNADAKRPGGGGDRPCAGPRLLWVRLCLFSAIKPDWAVCCPSRHWFLTVCLPLLMGGTFTLRDACPASVPCNAGVCTRAGGEEFSLRCVLCKRRAPAMPLLQSRVAVHV